MNKDTTETTKDLQEPIALHSPTLEKDHSEASPSTISEESSTMGTISTEELMNEIAEEILEQSLLQVRKNKDKNETENDHG